MKHSLLEEYMKTRARLMAQWNAVAKSTTFRVVSGVAKYAAHIHETSVGNSVAFGAAILAGVALGTDVAYEFGLNARLATMAGVATGVATKSALSYVMTAPGRAWSWMRGKNREP